MLISRENGHPRCNTHDKCCCHNATTEELDRLIGRAGDFILDLRGPDLAPVKLQLVRGYKTGKGKDTKHNKLTVENWVATTESYRANGELSNPHEETSKPTVSKVKYVARSREERPVLPPLADVTENQEYSPSPPLTFFMGKTPDPTEEDPFPAHQPPARFFSAYSPAMHLKPPQKFGIPRRPVPKSSKPLPVAPPPVPPKIPIKSRDQGKISSQVHKSGLDGTNEKLASHSAFAHESAKSSLDLDTRTTVSVHDSSQGSAVMSSVVETSILPPPFIRNRSRRRRRSVSNSSNDLCARLMRSYELDSERSRGRSHRQDNDVTTTSSVKYTAVQSGPSESRYNIVSEPSVTRITISRSREPSRNSRTCRSDAVRVPGKERHRRRSSCHRHSRHISRSRRATDSHESGHHEHEDPKEGSAEISARKCSCHKDNIETTEPEKATPEKELEANDEDLFDEELLHSLDPSDEKDLAFLLSLIHFTTENKALRKQNSEQDPEAEAADENEDEQFNKDLEVYCQELVNNRRLALIKKSKEQVKAKIRERIRELSSQSSQTPEKSCRCCSCSRPGKPDELEPKTQLTVLQMIRLKYKKAKEEEEKEKEKTEEEDAKKASKEEKRRKALERELRHAREREAKLELERRERLRWIRNCERTIDLGHTCICHLEKGRCYRHRHGRQH